jgi:predicted GH43/DUF377 family glycosyl hydrolase
MPKLIRAAMIVIAVFGVATAQALEKFDFEQKFFVEFGPEIKDHSLIQVDGLYHLFYLRGNPAVDIGHATSLNLANWSIEEPILYVEPGTWDEQALWAPQVFPSDNGYIMYYTGVNNAFAQRAGIAFSSDLYNWYKLPWPVYTPDTSWALWAENTFSHGRDPFVFDYNGMSYMLNTAKTPANKGAISLASSLDRFAWTDQGPLYVHNTWHVMESVQMIPHDNKYHLFFTEEAVNGTSWSTNDNPNPLVGWDLTNASVIDFGHAPEVNQFEPDKYTFSRHATTQMPGGSPQWVLRFDELRWTTDFPYLYKPWPLINDWTMVSGVAFLYGPTFLNNPAVRGDNVDVGYQGDSWISSYEQYQGPLGIGAPGAYQGEAGLGVIHSRTFDLSGNSMSLLVGGSNQPDDCYVALVKADNGAVLFKETGKDTDALDSRKWNTRPFKNTPVYIEIADNSTTGHICVDDIVESNSIIGGGGTADDGSLSRPGPTRGNPRGSTRLTAHIPSVVALRQNIPNPFNPTTTITFDLPYAAEVSVEIFDVTGQRVRQLHSGREEIGTHDVTWDGRADGGASLSSGVYFYRLSVDGRSVDTKKMILLK